MRLFIGLLTASLLTSCISFVGERGNGVMTEETFQVGEFNRIEVGGEFIIRLTQGEGNEVKIEADENLLDYICLLYTSDAADD